MQGSTSEEITCHLKRIFEDYSNARSTRLPRKDVTSGNSITRVIYLFQGLSREFFRSTYALRCILFPEEEPQVMKYYSNIKNLNHFCLTISFHSLCFLFSSKSFKLASSLRFSFKDGFHREPNLFSMSVRWQVIFFFFRNRDKTRNRYLKIQAVR